MEKRRKFLQNYRKTTEGNSDWISGEKNITKCNEKDTNGGIQKKERAPAIFSPALFTFYPRVPLIPYKNLRNK